MKRDMDTIRRIILATAAMPYGETLDSIDGMPEDEFITHVIWLQEAGLLVADARAGAGSMAKYAIVSRLTWAGCEFADSVLDDDLWNKAKGAVLKPGMSFTFEVLKDWMKTEITNGLPTLRSLAN